jgi:hypothetical protein
MTALEQQPLLIDACPVCQPGIPKASTPKDAQAVNGGSLASYECGTCETTWRTWWDCHGWPVDRRIEPVTPDQAAQNRDILLRALGGG